MDKLEFLKVLEDGGYITRKKDRELYIEDISVKENYGSEDIILAYRWYTERKEHIEWLDYRRNEMGGTTKRYKQSGRMGSDSV